MGQRNRHVILGGKGVLTVAQVLCSVPLGHITLQVVPFVTTMKAITLGRPFINWATPSPLTLSLSAPQLSLISEAIWCQWV